MNINWRKNLTKYWIKVELETEQVLRMVKDDFQSSGMSFDEKFKDYFVRTTNIRIAMTFDKFLSDFEFEAKFIGAQPAQAPANQNPIDKPTVVANGEAEAMTSHPMAEPILNGVYTPCNDSFQHLTSFLSKNVNRGHITATIETMFGNVTVPTTAIRIDPNASGQTRHAIANYVAQKENDMIPTANTDELPNKVMANRTAIDPIAPASIGQANSTAIWPQGLPASTPFHGLVEQPETNAPLYATFQPIESFMDRNIDANDATFTIDAMLGNASKLTPQIDQSQAIEANETEPNGATNAIDLTEITNGTTPPDATGLAFSDLADINVIDFVFIEPNDIELPNDTIVDDDIGIDMVTSADQPAASSVCVNESIIQCIDLTCGDVELPSRDVSNQLKQNVVRQEENQRRKRKNTDTMTSDGSATKRRKMNRRPTMKTIPESNSEAALVNLTLNNIESSEQASSTSSEPVQDDGAGSSGEGNQSTTSNAKQVAKKKGGVGKRGGGSGSKEHKCAFCEYIAPFASKLTTHERRHTDEKPFKCKVCARGFCINCNLTRHMKTHANEFPFHCSIYRQGFKVKKAKEAHEKSCDPRRFECYLCKYSTFLKPDLVRHMRIHNGDKPFRCGVCSRGFSQNVVLTKHMRTHATAFPFHCSICRQGFNAKKAKEAHEKSCDPRRFECYLCKYSTLEKSNLVTHMRQHTGNKPFRCSQCSERYANKSGLQWHLKRHDNKTK